MSDQNILKDFQPQDEFAAEHGVSKHTVARYRQEPDGLPYAMFGGKVFIHLPGAQRMDGEAHPPARATEGRVMDLARLDDLARDLVDDAREQLELARRSHARGCSQHCQANSRRAGKDRRRPRQGARGICARDICKELRRARRARGAPPRRRHPFLTSPCLTPKPTNQGGISVHEQHTTNKRTPTARELVAARQRRQKDLPIEPAGKKPAGKELKIVSKEPAPVRQAARADNRRYIDRYLDEVDPVTIAGRIIRFKDGRFYTKDDGEDVPKDTVFAALIDQLLVGYCKFNGPNQQPDRIMGLLFDGFEPPEKENLPDRDESLWETGLDGEPEDPWGEHNYLPLQDVASR